MGGGKIGDMNVVADRGAVWGIVIVPKHREVGNVTLQCHHGAWNEMGFMFAQFANAADASAPLALK